MNVQLAACWGSPERDLEHRFPLADVVYPSVSGSSSGKTETTSVWQTTGERVESESAAVSSGGRPSQLTVCIQYEQYYTMATEGLSN